MTILTTQPIIHNATSYDDLVDEWFDARFAGDHKRAKTISSYLASNGGSVFSGKITEARVAPAAGFSDLAALELPRSGNTGGTFSGDITDKISIHRHCDDVIKSIGESKGLCKVDWLSVSFSSVTDETEQAHLFGFITDFLGDYSVDVHVRDKGLHGYSNSAILKMCGDVSGDVNCGMLAWSDKQGLFLELSGHGCEYVRDGFPDLYRLITVNAGRISRVDVCLDLENKYCIDSGITVPLLGEQAYKGVYRSRYTPKGVKQSMHNEGDWSALTYGHITPKTYNPSVDAPNGLTAYVGSVKSDNQIVFYEKGKQLLGSIDDSDYVEYQRLLASGSNRPRLVELMNDNGLDVTYEGQKHWVRTERRFRRGSNKKWLAPEILLAPDQAFVQDYSGLEKMHADYLVWLKRRGMATIDFSKRTADLTKSIMVTRKMHWCKVAYGRLVNTLQDLGMTADQIIEALTRADGLKDYVSDISDKIVSVKEITKGVVKDMTVRCSYSPAEWYA